MFSVNALVEDGEDDMEIFIVSYWEEWFGIIWFIVYIFVWLRIICV